MEHRVIVCSASSRVGLYLLKLGGKVISLLLLSQENRGRRPRFSALPPWVLRTHPPSKASPKWNEGGKYDKEYLDNKHEDWKSYLGGQDHPSALVGTSSYGERQEGVGCNVFESLYLDTKI